MSQRRSSAQRNAVVLVTAREGWRPQRPWDIPDGIVSGEIFAKNLPAEEAASFARTHNANALKASQVNRGAGWDRQWALVVKCIRPQWHGDRHGARAGTQAGAEDAKGGVA